MRNKEEIMLRCIIAMAVMALAVFGPVLLVGQLAIYINIPTIIIGLILPILYVSILLGFKETIYAFTDPFDRNPVKERLLMARTYFKTLNKVILLSSILCVLMGAISMFDFYSTSRVELLEESDSVAIGMLDENGANEAVSLEGSDRVGVGLFDENGNIEISTLFAGMSLGILPLYQYFAFALIFIIPFQVIIKKKLNE